jgi:F-type H+-transporting ATPase subunit b
MSTTLILAASAAGTVTAQIATVVVAFIVVILVLKTFVWKGVLGAIDERRESIRRQFDEIDRKQAELASMTKDYEERLRRIDEEARERMNKAIDEGRRIAADLTEQARKDADAYLERAQATIRIETEKARIELRDEIVTIAMMAAERLLRQRLDDEGQRAMVRAFVAEMEDKSRR